MSSPTAPLPDPDASPDLPAWLEILPVLQDAGGVWYLRPPGRDSWRVRCGGPVRLAVARRLVEAGLEASVVHSTSWREVEDAVLLTHLAVLGSGAVQGAGFERRPVLRSELARGTATWPPAAVRVDHVVEHALRHLAWLHVEDPSVRSALEPDWQRRLGQYRPEPFRVFERPPATVPAAVSGRSASTSPHAAPRWRFPGPCGT
jgi:hypothetical protein